MPENISNSHPGVELPFPEEYFRRLKIASRSTFQRWEAQGLRVLKVGGRRFIYASDLDLFINSQDAASRRASAELGEKLNDR